MLNIWSIVKTIYEMLLEMIFGFSGDNYNSFETETREIITTSSLWKNTSW